MRCKIPRDDLAQRLDSTFCTYNGEPVFVRVDGGILMLYNAWKTATHLTNIEPEDPGFDVSTPPLGYFQYAPGEVGFMSREPARKYKQGFDKTVMKCTDLTGAYEVETKLNTEAVRNMMAKHYPSISATLKFVKHRRDLLTEQGHRPDYPIAFAISNDCALCERDNEVQVWYRCRKVGTLVLNKPGKPVIEVPSSREGWLVSVYLRSFDWVVQ